MLVIRVRRTSRQTLMMKVGQGSKSQELVGDCDLSFSTSSLVNERKEIIGGVVLYDCTSPANT